MFHQLHSLIYWVLTKLVKIDIFDAHSYVAIKQESVDKALSYLKNGKIKGRSFMVRKSQW